MKQNLSVILIAHNEEENIGKMIDGLLEYYNDSIGELIVIDDASQDNTSSIVESWQAKNHKIKLVKRQPPCGAGRALKTGFATLSPDAEYVLTMDSDFVENIKEVRKLLEALEEKNYDGVIGSRFIKGSRRINYPFSKKVMNRMFHCIVRFVFRIKQRDLTNNFKLYRASIFRNLPWKSNGFSINAETGLLPIIAGFKIGEVPISWIGRNSDMGKSKFNMLKSGLGYINVIAYTWEFSRIRKNTNRLFPRAQ